MQTDKTIRPTDNIALAIWRGDEPACRQVGIFSAFCSLLSFGFGRRTCLRQSGNAKQQN